MRRLIGAVLIGALLFSAAPAHGETKKPTPKPTVTKKTATAKPKVTAKPKASTTSKPKATVSSKPKTTAKPSPTKAATAKKKVVVKKKRKKKKAPPLPPEEPLPWPPVDFTPNLEVNPDFYMKIGLVDAALKESQKKDAKSKIQLRQDLSKCEDFACGVVTVAAESRCDWWEITSIFEKVPLEDGGAVQILGTLKTVSDKTNSRQYQSIILLSNISGKDTDGNIRKDIRVRPTNVTCHRDSAPDLSNRNIFTPAK